MQTKAVLSFFALVAAVAGAAVPQDDLAKKDSGASVQACPPEFSVCGECNGSSCKVAGINYGCYEGKCTAQSGGGDGKICGWPADGGNGLVCPGRG